MLIYNSSFLLRLNVCNDLAKAMKALDGEKKFEQFRELEALRKIAIVQTYKNFRNKETSNFRFFLGNFRRAEQIT